MLNNPLSMSGLQPIEPMYSLSYSKGNCYWFSLLFCRKENNRDKTFYVLHKKYHFQGFHFVPETALNLVKTMELMWAP